MSEYYDDNDISSSSNIVEQSIDIMEYNDGLCVHPLHYHSFQIQNNILLSLLSPVKQQPSSVSSSFLPFRNFYSNSTNSSSSKKMNDQAPSSTVDTSVCILCEEPFSTLSSRILPQIFYQSRTNTISKFKSKQNEIILKCLACNALAHRSCATTCTRPVPSIKNVTSSHNHHPNKNNNNKYHKHQQCCMNLHKIQQHQQQQSNQTIISTNSNNMEENSTIIINDDSINQVITSNDNNVTTTCNTIIPLEQCLNQINDTVDDDNGDVNNAVTECDVNANKEITNVNNTNNNENDHKNETIDVVPIIQPDVVMDDLYCKQQQQQQQQSSTSSIQQQKQRRISLFPGLRIPIKNNVNNNVVHHNNNNNSTITTRNTDGTATRTNNNDTMNMNEDLSSQTVSDSRNCTESGIENESESNIESSNNNSIIDGKQQQNQRHQKILHSMKQNVSLTAVAGGIAGGIAGMALIGPAGAVYACYLGVGGVNVLLGLESAATMSMIVAGIATGTMTGQQIHNHHLDESNQRIITMSRRENDPDQRTVLLVRPNIIIDPIWEQICNEAMKSAPKSVKQQHHQRQSANDVSDIISTNENEIDTSDKILLLVSRILNDKTSIPGYILRYLIETYNDRCQRRVSICATNQSIIDTNHRIRRDDAHAIIKHVTATLINVRPEFGTTTTSNNHHFMELIASAVESIVFGQIYDSVMEEIINDTIQYDVELWRKITLLYKEHPELMKYTLSKQGVEEGNEEQHQSLDIDDSSNSSSNNLPIVVSQKAMETFTMISKARSVSDKLHFCVKFIDNLSKQYSTNKYNDNNSKQSEFVSADILIQIVCQHILFVENYGNIYAQIRFLEEFVRDEQLMFGYDGYALVTIQASIHVLSECNDLYNDIFLS